MAQRSVTKTGRGLGRAPALLARACRPDSSVTYDKDDLMDTLFWLRTLGALAAGAVYGLAGVTGGPPALGFLGAAIAGGLAWARAAGVDDDEAYGGLNALLTEGMGPAFALFLVSEGDMVQGGRREGRRAREGGGGQPTPCVSLTLTYT